MKHYFKYLMVAALAATVSFTACEDDDNEDIIPNDVNLTVTLDLPLGIENPVLNNANVTATNVATKTTYTGDFALTGDQTSATILVPEGTYNLDVKGEITYTLNSVDVKNPVRATAENVTLTGKKGEVVATDYKLALTTYNTAQGFVLTEIFFTGTLTPEGKQYGDDQYFKVGNNSDEVLYLDGLAFVESEFMTVDKQDYTPDLMEQAMTIDAIYVFPGSGTDYPVQPGQEVIVAINAKNHTEENSDSFDLSTADFEIYDESENPNFQDDQNPAVPDLINWYDYSASYFGMHNRGFHSYALAKPECTAEEFIENYLYTYTYKFTFGEWSFDMDGDAYQLPNSWIVDAVNLSVEAEWQWNVVSATLDAGYAHCGSVDHDQTRYGKSVIRKKTADGKWVDTNNSTNDFESDAKASLLP